MVLNKTSIICNNDKYCNFDCKLFLLSDQQKVIFHFMVINIKYLGNLSDLQYEKHHYMNTHAFYQVSHFCKSSISNVFFLYKTIDNKGPVNIYQNMGPVQMGRGHKLFYKPICMGHQVFLTNLPMGHEFFLTHLQT